MMKACLLLAVLPAWAQIPLAPTAEDQLPAAILGQGSTPRGEKLAYFEGHPKTRGYLAVPEGAGPFPAVILIHEWNGLVTRIEQVADAFAAEGYVALAADLYSGRTGSSRVSPAGRRTHGRSPSSPDPSSSAPTSGVS